jgi:ketosteroid isomerase-like protein
MAADGNARIAAAEDSVAATVHAFHDALAAADSARALTLLHPDLRVFESGHAEDLEEYRGGHLGADMEFAGSTERELLAEEVIRLDEELALYLSEYRVAGSFRDREVDGHGTETMLLERGPEAWRIRHIHWSSR